MKKIGRYLKCVLPLVVMLGIQVIASSVQLMRYILQYGLTAGTNAYMNDTMQVLLMSDVLVLLIFSLWYFVSVRKRHKQQGNKERSLFEIRDLGKLLLLAVGMQFLIGIFLSIWQILDPTRMNDYSELMDDVGIGTLSLLSVFTAAIIGPIEEELVFRGVTAEYLKRAGASFWLLNILQALLFGIAHLNLIQGSYAFFIGLVSGYLVLRYRSIFAGMTFHILFNAYNYFAIALEGILNWVPDVLVLLVYTVGGVWLTVYSLRSIRQEIRKKEEAEKKEEEIENERKADEKETEVEAVDESETEEQGTEEQGTEEQESFGCD